MYGLIASESHFLNNIENESAIFSMDFRWILSHRLVVSVLSTSLTKYCGGSFASDILIAISILQKLAMEGFPPIDLVSCLTSCDHVLTTKSSNSSFPAFRTVLEPPWGFTMQLRHSSQVLGLLSPNMSWLHMFVSMLYAQTICNNLIRTVSHQVSERSLHDSSSKWFLSLTWPCGRQIWFCHQ